MDDGDHKEEDNERFEEDVRNKLVKAFGVSWVK
jgi:hypothetical protein